MKDPLMDELNGLLQGCDRAIAILEAEGGYWQARMVRTLTRARELIAKATLWISRSGHKPEEEDADAA